MILLHLPINHGDLRLAQACLGVGFEGGCRIRSWEKHALPSWQLGQARIPILQSAVQSKLRRRN